MASAERRAEVDALRGVALAGIGLVNVPFLALPTEALTAPAEGPDLVVRMGIAWLLQGKVFGLFSFLFGWGLAVQMAAAARAGVSGPARFRRRLLGLGVLGALHGALVFDGDILLLYALLGVPLLALREAPTRRLVRLAAACVPVGFATLAALAVLVAAEKGADAGAAGGLAGMFEVWATGFAFVVLFNGPLAFGAFCLGLAAARAGIFEPDAPIRAALRRRLPWLLGAGLALNLPYALAATGALGEGVAALIGFATLAATGPLLGAAWGVLALEAAGRGRLPASFAAVGRMSLTGYVLHGVLAGLVFGPNGLGLWGTLGPAAILAVSAGIVAAVQGFAVLWLARFGRGPLEAGLRAFVRWGEGRGGAG